jgi:HEAT repeats
MIGRDRTRFWIRLVGIVVPLLGSSEYARAQQEPAVETGVRFLRARYAGKPAGESAMIALGLLKAEVPHADPAVQACISKIRSRFSSGGYNPEMGDGRGTYEATAVVMALSNLDPVENKSLINMLATYLLGNQNANGSWDYKGREKGDTSISQYAVLGLWEVENAGIEVPPSVWDRAAGWFLSVQHTAGGWNYHPDEGGRYTDTVAMTAAGVGSLLICQRQLERYRPGQRRGGAASALLTPLTTETTQVDYHPSTSSVEITKAVQKGLAWISSNFAPNNPTLAGQSSMYMLYGLERIGALADRTTIGRLDWFEKGRSYLRSSQQADGAWRQPPNTDEMNTVWAVLFLTKSTAKSIRKIEIRRLAAGTLLGGRGLPKDLTSMTVAGGRVVSRPMNGAVEGMLAVLEDPRAEQADAAVAGLEERYRLEGPASLRPFKSRFRKMLTDRDPGVRQVAVWGLARIGDLDVVPILIDALIDADDEVVKAARLGLQLLSRKIEGLGPDVPSSPEERRAAADRWRAWYAAIRPLDLDDQDEDTGDAKRPASPAANNDPQPGSSPQ